MRLKKITLQGFRGFNRKQVIPLDKQAVLIYGHNGSGKSSLVEAVEWLFYDGISRKERSKCRGEYSGDFLRNLHYDGEENPFVEVLTEIDGTEITFRKEIISARRNDLFVDGNAVDDFSAYNINIDPLFKPILGQSEIKRFVDTEQKDRWSEISKILGLEDFDSLRGDLLEARNGITNNEPYTTVSETVSNIIYNLESVDDVEHFVATLKKSPLLKDDLSADLLLCFKKTFAGDLEKIKDYKDVIEKEKESITKQKSPDLYISEISEKFNEEIELNLKSILSDAKQLITKLVQIKDVKSDEIEFLKQGLTLIDNNICPFCKEPTITAEKKSHIEKCLAENEQVLEVQRKLKEAQQNLDSAKDDFLSRIRPLIPNEATINLALEQMKENPDLTPEFKALNDFRDVSLKQINLSIERNELFTSGFTNILSSSKEPSQLETLEEKLSIIEKDVYSLIALLLKANGELIELKQKIEAKTRKLSETDEHMLQRLNFILAIIERYQELVLFAVYEQKTSELTDLIEKLENFEIETAESLLKGLSKQIKRYYTLLNPREKIVFDGIIPRRTGRSRKAEICGKSYGKEMNPVTCFSEAHTNCLGLSLYFPQRVDNNTHWDFMMLDDPVQSMDSKHSQNLIRILKDKSQNKQIIVLTHSLGFKKDFTDLFHGNDLLTYRFYEHDETGPQIECSLGGILDHLALAKEKVHGSSLDLKNAGGNTRQSLEYLMSAILTQKGGLSRKKVEKMKLEEKIEMSETRGFISSDDVGEIKMLLTTLDSASHGDPQTDVIKSRVLDGIELLERLHSEFLASLEE